MPQEIPTAIAAITSEVPAAYRPLLIIICEVAFEKSGTVTYILYANTATQAIKKFFIKSFLYLWMKQFKHQLS